MNLKVSLWIEKNDLSESLLLERYSSKIKFMTSISKYNPNEVVGRTHKEGVLFVLGGKCKFSANGETAILAKNSVLRFPRGDSEIKVVGNNIFHFVTVWDLDQIAKIYG